MFIDKKYLYIIAALAVIVFVATFALVRKPQSPTWQGSDGTKGVSKSTPLKPSKK
jgi:hypothetical protein